MSMTYLLMLKAYIFLLNDQILSNIEVLPCLGWALSSPVSVSVNSEPLISFWWLLHTRNFDQHVPSRHVLRPT